MQKIIRIVLLFFAFALSVGIVLWENALLFTKDIFPASIETSASNIGESQNPPPTPRATISKPEGLILDASSAISIEVGIDKEKLLFAKNTDQQLPIASLTKLMTALVVLEQYDLNQKITINEKAIAQEGEQGDLKLGQVLSVRNLLYITLIESSNRSAYALSEIMGIDKFIDAMNDTAQKLNLISTHFQDSTGLDIKSYSTSRDLAVLSGHLFKNYPLFREITSLKEYNLYLNNGSFHHKLVNTNQLLDQVNNIIGGKTGWTNMAKGCFMVIEDNPKNKSYFIHIILGSEDRFGEMKKLIDWVHPVK